MNHTDLDLIVAELMFPILVELAPTGETITYKNIAELLKLRNTDVPEIQNITQRHIGRKLGTIWEFTKSQGCPHIGSLVVIKGGDCGIGISNVITDLPKEREKVKNFDWSTISLGFESYISRAKLIKKEREKKKIKLTRDEAKEKVSSYWKKIKEEAPVTRDDAVEMKENLVSLVQDGLSPEEAFSQEFLKFIASKNRETPENGYVYIGEYINSDTKQPLFDQLKIGFTTNLENRATALSGGVSGPLEFEMKCFWEFNSSVAYAVEQSLHGKFSDFRKNGEFFTNEQGLLIDLVDDEITERYGDLLKSTSLDLKSDT